MSSKVIEINIELNKPTVDAALQYLKNALSTYKRQGYKAVIIIHGYGSSGSGGAIKPAVVSLLSGSGMRGIVKAYASGEQWYLKKNELLRMCGGLAEHERRFAGNPGVTVVILQ
ncbi:MAG TPA: Smr/MutS family protein [Clostridia bacterium]|nr:Smr/MutS family protein [Clostridia bacterium]